MSSATRHMAAVAAAARCATGKWSTKKWVTPRASTLYLPLNDPLRNPVNKWQVLAHRSNNDFQPLIDHFRALEYMTKYASKAEKGSKSLDMLLAAKPLHT